MKPDALFTNSAITPPRMMTTTSQMMNEMIDKIKPMIPVILPVFENWFSE